MIDPSRIRFAGPLSLHRDGLWAELLARGYSPLSSRNLLRLMAHLSRWLEAEGIEPEELDPARIEKFLEHRRTAGYTCWRSPRGLEPVLRHLRCAGAIPTATPTQTEPTALDLLLGEYEEYLVRERALASVTVSGYVCVARQFLYAKFGTERLDLDRLSAGDVTSFVLQQSRSCSVGFAKNKVTSLRSLLRYLHVRGDIESDLSSAAPAVAGWRLVALPKALAPAEVRKLLKSCDRRTPVGRRDFAVLLLMIRLGLRSSEVAALHLDDLNWDSGELLIRGKGRREDRLPLAADLGEALVSYLKGGRPRSTSRQLFLRVHAPQGALSPGAVRAIVSEAGQRIGLTPLGSHRLRHTAATQMLRSGASLLQIAQVLRHRHLDTTAIYAKVDRRRLRSLARRWPGGTR